MRPVCAVIMPVLGLLLLRAGAPDGVVAALLVPGTALLAYVVMARVNAGCYLYEGGFLQVVATGRIRFATRWSDVDIAGSSYAAVENDPPPAEVMWYVVIRKDGQRAEFGVGNLRGATELFETIRSRRTRGRRRAHLHRDHAVRAPTGVRRARRHPSHRVR